MINKKIIKKVSNFPEFKIQKQIKSITNSSLKSAKQNTTTTKKEVQRKTADLHVVEVPLGQSVDVIIPVGFSHVLQSFLHLRLVSAHTY